jgi:hypothetical protein
VIGQGPACSKVATFAQVLDDKAKRLARLVISMKKGGKRIVAFEQRPTQTGGATRAFPRRSLACGGKRLHLWSSQENRGGSLWHR